MNTNTNTAPILALLELVREARTLAARNESRRALRNVEQHAANLAGRDTGAPLDRDIWAALDRAQSLLDWAMEQAQRAV